MGVPQKIMRAHCAVIRPDHFKFASYGPVPGNILEGTDDPGALYKWLTLYIAETRKQDVSKCPLKTFYSLLTGLLRHSRAQNLNCPNFLNNRDHRFDALHNAVDNVFHELCQTSTCSETKSTITDTRSMQ